MYTCNIRSSQELNKSMKIEQRHSPVSIQLDNCISVQWDYKTNGGPVVET